MNNKNLENKKAFLLVSFYNLISEETKQELLEIALKYEVIPYSNSNSQNTYIFEATSNEVLSLFNDKLLSKNFTISTQKFFH